MEVGRDAMEFWLRAVRPGPGSIVRVEAAKKQRLVISLGALPNLGLIGMVWAQPMLTVCLPVVAALAFSALCSYVSVPRPHYSAGFTGVSLDIGLVGIDMALAKLACKPEPAES
jgi:hypothetical protein